MPGVHLLSITAAGRAESSGQYSYRTWQAGAAWQVTPALRLRGSKATSFVTPTLAAGSPISVPPSQPWFLIDDGEWIFGADRPFIIQGGNPELQPEHGFVYSYGAEWTPGFADRLTVGVNFSHSSIFDRISQGPFFSLIAIVTPELERRFPDSVKRDADGKATQLDARSVNLAFAEQSSLDYRVDYRIDTVYGDFGARLNVSRSRYHNTLRTQHDAEFNPEALDRLVGEIIPKYSQRAAIYWEHRGARLGLNFHHRSDTGFEDGDGRMVRAVPPLVTNLVSSYDFGDGFFQAPEFLRSIVVDFGVNNVAKKFTRRIVDGEEDNSRVAGLFNSSRGTHLLRSIAGRVLAAIKGPDVLRTPVGSHSSSPPFTVHCAAADRNTVAIGRNEDVYVRQDRYPFRSNQSGRRCRSDRPRA